MKKKVSYSLKKIKKNVIEYIITNRLFLSYVILSLICALFARKYTIEIFWSFKPFITDLGLILMIGAIGYFIKPKNQFKYYFTWIIIFSILAVVSSVYYTFFTSFASFGELSTMGQVETVTNSVVEKLRFIDLMYLFIPFIFYYIHLKLLDSTYYHFVEKIEKGKKMVTGTILVGVLCIGYSFGTATGTDYSRLSKQWNRVYIVERFGLILYQFNDLVQSLAPRFSSLFGKEEALEKFTIYYDDENKVHEENKYTGILNGYNIVFVHMESMQNFLMDVNINGVELTPNLNQLAKEGMFFSNFYPQVSTGTSSDTEFTLLTGLLPAYTGTVFVSYYKRNYFTIPKYLQEKGYYTFSMHGNFSSMWNRNQAHPSLGYQGMYFEESFNYLDEDVVNLGINDYRFFEQAIPILENVHQTYNNYMGTIITLSNHSPFFITAENSLYDLSMPVEIYNEKTGLTESIRTNYLADSAIGEYMKSVNYADGALGEFLRLVKESSAFDNTLFVFYGDHDAKLSRSEINYYYNLDPKTGEVYKQGDPNFNLYDYYAHELNKKTPLIFWSKNKSLSRIFNGEITYTMGMYDVAPTILNMYGLYNKYTVGNDIFNIKNNNLVVFPNGNILTNEIYYNNSTGKHKDLKENIQLNETQIEELKKIAEQKLEISNYIIVYDLLDEIFLMGE